MHQHMPRDSSRAVAGALLLGAFLGLATPAGAASGPERVDWLSSLDLALEEAILTRRPVLLNFTATWCGWCRRLEATTFRDPGFIQSARSFVTVQVDGDKERGLASLYRVKGYPTTVFLDRRGREIGRIVGYRDAASFAAEMARALQGREPISEVRKAAEENPGDARAQYELGDVLLAVGEYEEARAAFQRALDLAGSSQAELADDAELDLALTRIFAYDFVDALPLLDAYLAGGKDRPRHDEALFFSGLALVRTGQTEEGFDRLDRAAGETSSSYIRFEVERLKAQWEEAHASG